jgi:PAS domain S-box-containing protein
MQYINAQTETLFGYTRNELIGQSIELLMPVRFAAHHPQHRRHFFTVPQLRPMGSGRELYALTKTGDEFPVEISLSPISASGGMLAAAAVRDISERKRTEQELQAAKQEAEQANLTKSRFLAAASHDLRQPLQTISALQAILSRTVKDTAARKHINSLASAVSTMEGMLHALLDINKLESGSITPELSDFPAASLLARLRSEFSYLANDKGLILRILPSRAILRSDPHLLQDILQNFVGNAMKYTDQGKVLVGCRRRDGWLHIEVWDTGPGIAEDERLRIFDEFYRIETPERNRKRGLGLGLAIAQRLAQLLEHPLNVRSAPGRGSMFAVAVPFGAPSDADMADITMVDPDSAEASILYIEDDPTILDAMQTLLGLEGFRVFPANTAAEAMELVTRQGCRPDLIVTDYHLPAGETGQGVISRLRQVLHDRSIPAIMVTGDNTKIRVREAAAIDCLVLSKPVNPDLLVDTLRSLLDKST